MVHPYIEDSPSPTLGISLDNVMGRTYTGRQWLSMECQSCWKLRKNNLFWFFKKVPGSRILKQSFQNNLKDLSNFCLLQTFFFDKSDRKGSYDKYSSRVAWLNWDSGVLEPQLPGPWPSSRRWSEWAQFENQHTAARTSPGLLLAPLATRRIKQWLFLLNVSLWVCPK